MELDEYEKWIVETFSIACEMMKTEFGKKNTDTPEFEFAKEIILTSISFLENKHRGGFCDQ